MEDPIQLFFNELKSDKRVAYFNTSKSELSTRCPYCGDSTKSAISAHLYISTDPPYSFYCQRCETKGLLNLHTIRDFNIENIEIGQILKKNTTTFFRNTNKDESNINALISGESKRKLVLPSYREGKKIHEKKVKYIEDRLGVELSKRDLFNLKVITSNDDFLEINNLKNVLKFYNQSDYHKDLKKWLNSMSVGFLSTDTNYINYRHIELPPNNRRYYTQNNNGFFNIGHKIFTIRNKVDILTSELNLILAEGPFDIASIYLNLYDRLDSTNTIFSAVNGKAYPLVITLLRRMGFTKINLHIYSDIEVQKEYYAKILNFEYFSNIRVHYNIYPNEKDFGVSKSKIKDKVYKLK